MQTRNQRLLQTILEAAKRNENDVTSIMTELRENVNSHVIFPWY